MKPIFYENFFTNLDTKSAISSHIATKLGRTKVVGVYFLRCVHVGSLKSFHSEFGQIDASKMQSSRKKGEMALRVCLKIYGTTIKMAAVRPRPAAAAFMVQLSAAAAQQQQQYDDPTNVWRVQG